MKALVFTDSRDLVETISVILRVRWPDLTMLQAVEAREGMDLIHREQPDIVMLHFDSAATADSFDFIGEIRSFSDVPIVIVSKENDVTDEVRALEMGADDWIVLASLPIMAFIARVNAILRRCSAQNKESTSSFFNGKLMINCTAHEILVEGKMVKLTPIEYKIIHQLAKNGGGVVSSASLLHSAWGPDYRSDPDFLKKYIYRLRAKIEHDPANPELILTERGVGYRLSESGSPAG
jgi:two-component system KDP operon response regulator KdpE